MISYDQALDAYTIAIKPPRAKFWQTSPDNGKPLRSTSDKHKSIHKTDTGVIYFRLYDTHVATFHPVNPQTNTYTVFMQYYNSVTTNKFMGDFRLHYGYLRVAGDRRVSLPYAQARGSDRLSAVLTFNADTNVLLPEQSWHPTVCTYGSSKDDKEKRAAFRRAIDPYKTLAMLSIDRAVAEADVREEYSAAFFSPFNTWGARSFSGVKSLRTMANKYGVQVLESEPTAFAETFLQALPEWMSIHLSNAAQRVEAEKWRGSHTVTGWQTAVEQAVKSVEPDAFAKYVENQLISLFSLKQGTEHIPHPQFMQKLPSKFFIGDRVTPEPFLKMFRSL
jgi:hypothetical protein